MAADKLPDPETPFGATVRERLATDTVIWLTTVSKDGTPQPNPVWFIQDGEDILVYTQPTAVRLRHIKDRPQVALNLDTGDGGESVVVLTGVARLAPDAPPPDQHEAYVAKYAQRAAGVSGDVATFAATYSVAIRIEISKVRGF
jgi:PPOX class probable F420-dependent enzyme